MALAFYLACGLPDQRAIGEQPEVCAARVRSQQSCALFVMVLIGERSKSRRKPRVRNSTMNESNEVRGQRHLMSARHVEGSLRWRLSAAIHCSKGLSYQADDIVHPGLARMFPRVGPVLSSSSASARHVDPRRLRPENGSANDDLRLKKLSPVGV
jgi:hypothetical protein